MHTQTMEGLIGARTNMSLMNVPMRVYKEARQRGDTSTMERAMGYAVDCGEKAKEYKKKADEGMKEDAKEAREKEKQAREKAIQERRKERRELKERIEESKSEKSLEEKNKTENSEDASKKAGEAAGQGTMVAVKVSVVHTDSDTAETGIGERIDVSL